MSFLGDNQIPSPVEKTIKYKGSKGIFIYWDRESETEVEIRMWPFVPIAMRMSITGYNEQNNTGVWSNEIEIGSNASMRVHVGNTEVFQGVWKDIKNRVATLGGGYCSVVYAMMDGELVRFLFDGAACGSWIDVQKESRKAGRDGHKGVRCTGFEDKIKGAVKYKSPVFALTPVKNETLEVATKLLNELNEYFESRQQLPVEDPADDVNAELADAANDHQHYAEGNSGTTDTSPLMQPPEQLNQQREEGDDGGIPF